MTTDYPAYVEVPREIEEKAYVWSEYARGDDRELIAMRIAEAREVGLGAEQDARDPFPPALRRMFDDRASRRSAPEAVHPKGGLDHEAAWAAVERSRALMRDTVQGADGLALSRVIHNHPVFGTLNVYQLVELVANHEVRHSKQIAGIAEQFG